MPSPEITQALLAPETQKVLSLPMAALVLGALSQVETLMDIVDRVCEPYFDVRTAGSKVARRIQRELHPQASGTKQLSYSTNF
jgi:hypothetical protein